MLVSRVGWVVKGGSVSWCEVLWGWNEGSGGYGVARRKLVDG